MIKHMPYQGDLNDLEQRVIDRELVDKLPFAPASPLLDIHTITTAVMLEIPYSAVTKQQRCRVGKSMNFTALYDPNAVWEVPREQQLMAIWSEHEKDQLYTVLGIGKGEHNLYEALVNHFNKIYGGKA